MDPTTALDDLLTALLDLDREGAITACTNISGWLARGGFFPDALDLMDVLHKFKRRMTGNAEAPDHPARPEIQAKELVPILREMAKVLRWTMETADAAGSLAMLRIDGALEGLNARLEDT